MGIATSYKGFFYNWPFFPGGTSIFIGLYGGYFVYFRKSDRMEQQFRYDFSITLQVDFQGDSDWFLVTSLECNITQNGKLSIHMCQSAFAEHSAKIFGLNNCNKYPLATPYHSGLPIDSLPKSALPKVEHNICTHR